MKRFRFSVGLDCDDLLFSCIPYAVELANKEYNLMPPLTPEDITGWLPNGGRGDIILKYFSNPDFYVNQPILEGAKEFVRRLSEIAEVYFISSLPPICMGVRAMRLAKEFPEIPAENIYMGTKKEKIYTDFLFDDGAHNILRTSAAYPVLMRRPWNNHVTGVLAVNSYDDFLKIVEVVIDGYKEPKRKWREPVVMTLVGSSGSGKTYLSEKMLAHSNIEKPVSTTTRNPRVSEDDNAYNFVSMEDFIKLKNSNSLLEYTMYAGNGYGLEKAAIDEVLRRGHHAIMVMDMCGAMAVKSRYPHAITVYVDRDKKSRILSVLERDTDNEEKTNRILSMEYEDRNEELCDYTVNNSQEIEKTVEEVEEIIRSISTVSLD